MFQKLRDCPQPQVGLVEHDSVEFQSKQDGMFLTELVARAFPSGASCVRRRITMSITARYCRLQRLFHHVMFVYAEAQLFCMPDLLERVLDLTVQVNNGFKHDKRRVPSCGTGLFKCCVMMMMSANACLW